MVMLKSHFYMLKQSLSNLKRNHVHQQLFFLFIISLILLATFYGLVIIINCSDYNCFFTSSSICWRMNSKILLHVLFKNGFCVSFISLFLPTFNISNQKIYYIQSGASFVFDQYAKDVTCEF